MEFKLNQWLKEAEEYLISQWGLSGTFAKKAALLLAYFFQYGLNPQITSGYRSVSEQKALLKRWNAGDRTGLKAKPAESSLHNNSSWLRPAARAIDISTSNYYYAAKIAEAIGIGSGYRFNDPVHFFER